MFAAPDGRLRRSLTALSAVCLSTLGLTVGALVVAGPSPVSASVPCGTNGVFSVNTSNLATCTYTALGADTFTVPPGDSITSISIVVTGAGGAGGTSTANGPGTPDGGGNGAKVTNTTFAATAGDVEDVLVGGGGQPAPGGLAEGGGGASSSVDAGGTNQIIAGGGGGGGSDTSGGNAGANGPNYPGCSDGGGLAGSGGTGGVAPTSVTCSHGPTAPQSGGSGNGGAGGDSVEGGSTDVGTGGTGSGNGFGGHSSDFSGGGAGGYGGGAGGAGGGGGGGGGSTGGTTTLASNAGTGGAIHQQTPGGAGGDGEVQISYQIPPPPTNINSPTLYGVGHPGNALTCITSATDWTGNPTEFRYEFLYGTTVLQGPQTQDTYALGDSDAGRFISCSVSASNNGGPSAFVGSYPIAVTQPLTVTAPSPIIDYGASIPTLTPMYTGLINGDSAPSTPATCAVTPPSPTQASTYPVNCSGAFDAEYDPITYTPGTLTIDAVPLTITAPSPTVAYGQALPAFPPQYTGLTNGDSAPATPPTCAPTPANPKNAGTYPVTCTGAVDSNYTITYLGGTLTITPVPLHITAPSANVLDGKTPNLTPSYSGFVGGDTPASLTTAPSCTTTYNPAAFPLPLPGPYPVSCSGAVDHNYTITYASGTFTVYIHALPGAVDLAGPDGGVFVLGNPGGFYGSLPGLGIHVNDVVGIAATPDAKGYDLVGGDGGVFALGDGQFYGSVPDLGLHVSNIVGLVPTPDGGGYYVVGKDGGVYTFGDAVYHGSLPGLGQSVHDVVGIALTADGTGYWLAEASGAVTAFGGAASLGSAPSGGIVSITATQNGAGYWLTSASGGIFTYGNAPFQGSVPGLGLTVSNIITTVPSPNGGGYLVVGSDGGTFAFPNEIYPGSLAGMGLTIVGAAPSG